MRTNNLIRFWPVTLLLAGVTLLAVLAASSSPAQATAGERNQALQETPPPVITVPAVTVIVPETGGDTIIVDFFSNWALWAVLGILVIVLFIALLARPGGPDPHHHDV